MTKRVLLLFVCAATSAFGAMSNLDVAVSDAAGKAAFRGKTNSNGTFSTGNLSPGKYTVQFKGNDASLKGQKFFVVISSGAKKISSDSVAGEKFGAGGVAMKIDAASGANISGQVSTSKASTVEGGTKGLNTAVKYENGKKYVWLPPETGSHFGGRWVPADEKDAHSTGVRSASAAEFQNAKDSHGR